MAPLPPSMEAATRITSRVPPAVSAALAVFVTWRKRWLAQTLAHTLGAWTGYADGVCANVDFPPPGALLGGAVAAAGGIDRDTDPWLPERAVWPLLEVVEDCLGQTWLASLTSHLGLDGTLPLAGDDPRRDRRFAAISHLAGLYNRYAVHRPEMVRAWAEGRDVLADGTPMPCDSQWQAELWRCLRAHLEVPSPAERLPEACAALRRDPALAELPDRLALFGLTFMPASHLDVLRALAAQRAVHLLLLHPSPVLWKGIAASGHARGPVPRKEDLTAGTPANHPKVAGVLAFACSASGLCRRTGRDPASDWRLPPRRALLRRTPLGTPRR
jgi:exodeoxyribonuclease V gamma subunit